MLFHPKRSEKVAKVGSYIIALSLIGISIFCILNKKPFYKNYWGGIVFVPVTFIAGILGLYLTIFKWDKIKPFKKEK